MRTRRICLPWSTSWSAPWRKSSVSVDQLWHDGRQREGITIAVAPTASPERLKAVAAAGAATFVLLAPALYGVFSGADPNVPTIAALVATGLSAGALGIIGGVTAWLWMNAGYRPWAVTGVVIGSVLLWWVLIFASPALGLIYQNVTSPMPEDCENLAPGEVCL